MATIVFIIHIIISILLISAILLQAGRGGLGYAFGGGEHFRSKRGAEQLLFSFTIIISILFLLTSILSIMMR